MWGGGQKRTLSSTATWREIWRRPVGVNVFLLPDGTVGEGSTPPPGSIGAKCFLGGHVHEVTRYEAALLARAGYAHCLTSEVSCA